MAELGIDLTWGSTSEFLDTVDAIPKAVNFATLVGHGTVRAAGVGYDDRPPTADELAEMCRLVEEAMQAGAFGLSSGLVYAPGCYARTDELITLSRAAAQHGGFYATHMRNEGERLLDALDEALRVGRESGASVQISHHKACGRSSWGT
ncbi:MAG: D-aminoacylase, partial [Gemmatimonadales bacterium]|nr:D-aminoacylase [Gemmatimonadales bacterium]